MLIIPDVHGRDFWRKPVKKAIGKEHVLFLGDYMDPYEYEGITPSDALSRFKDIVALKKNHPDSITLLLGNHDIHYLTNSRRCRGGRYDYIRAEEIKDVFLENADLFQMTCSTESSERRYLFSHAGILARWIEQYKNYLNGATPDTIGDVLNNMWTDKSQWSTLFAVLSDVPYSRGGLAAFGSPIWSDVDDMRTDAPELPGYYQIFGHTQQENQPVVTEYFACLDVRRVFRLKEGVLKCCRFF